MTKQEQFLWIVQTTILANGISISTEPERIEKWRHEFSAVGAKNILADAVYASERIPETMTAAKAADDFCLYMIKSLYEGNEEERPELPGWFDRG